MKIGVLGGTFNPIHIGHLILAEESREKLGLDKVIFVPSNLPPHKGDAEVADASKRLAMLKSATKGNRFFRVSDIEIKRKGFSYTIDSIKELEILYPKQELFFITGSDLLKYLDGWKDLNRIIKMVKFVVAKRPGYPLEKIPSYISTLQIRAVDVSAFEIRSRIRRRKSFRYLVPEGVYKYIKENKLYL